MGASFGYHRAMDTAGAVAGPLIAAAALAAGLSLRSVLWIAVLPGFLTLVALRRVREAPKHTGAGQPIKRSELWRQPRAFWLILGVWVVFSIGNSSDVFLILRAHNLGLATTLTILAYALYNLVYSVLAWPLGALSDRLPRALIIGTGFAVFAIVYLGFGLTRASWSIWPLFAIYGAYVAATEGVAKAWIGDHVDAERSGTAYGVFAAATGVSMLLASVGAGVLWSRVGPGAPFYLGAASASLALVMLIIISVPWSRSPAERQRS